MVLTLHHTAQCIENGLRREVLGRDEIDEMLLTFFLLHFSALSHIDAAPERTFCRMLYTAGSDSSRDAESICWTVSVAFFLRESVLYILLSIPAGR